MAISKRTQAPALALLEQLTVQRLSVAGLGLFDQKSAIAETIPIVTAFKFCIGHRKNGLLNR
jgi:hypothetical protein